MSSGKTTRKLPAGFFSAVKWVDKVETALLVLALVSIILISFFNIILRNRGMGGIVWSDRLNINLVLLIAMIGSSAASRKKEHITIGLAYNLFPAGAHRYFEIISDLFSAVIAFMLTYYSFGLTVLEFYERIELIPYIQTWVPIAVMPLGFTLIGFRHAFHFLFNVSGAGKKLRSKP